MNDRFNTIAGWALGGGIVLLGGILVSSEMFSAHSDVKGYPIEGVEEASKGGGAEPEVPIATLLADADPGRGEALFKQCATCHTITPGGANGTGPNLHGILGQPIASRGFAYSDSLKEKSGSTWDWEQMSAWLRNPRRFAAGTKMSYAGLSDPRQRADLLVYLNAQGSNLPLPAPPAAAPAAEGGAANASGNAAGGNTSSGSTTDPAGPADAAKAGINTQAGAGDQPVRGGGEARPQGN